jgi:hypothetical protein
MLTAIRGNTSESAVLHGFLKRGFHVMLPFGGGCPFDLVVASEDGILIRIQVKTGWPEGGCVAFNTHSTDHGRGPGSYRGKADLFGVYFPALDQVYLVPVDAVGDSECRLRIEPTKNNQRRRVNMAEDFRIESWSDQALMRIVSAALGEQQLALTA